MPATLCNPNFPSREARYLVEQHALLPLAVRRQVTPLLERYLAKHPDCRRPAGALTATWPEAARAASARGQAVETFRLAQSLTPKLHRALKSLRLAIRHSESHESQQGREAAQNCLSGLARGRMTFEQLEAGLAEMRSQIRRAGNRRERRVARVVEETISVGPLFLWRRLLSEESLGVVGTELANCVAPSHPASKRYARELRRGETRFYALYSRLRSGALALISIDQATMTVRECRGPRNALVPEQIRAIRLLLRATKANAGYSDDLLTMGLATGFHEINRECPDLIVDDLRIWFGADNAVLLNRKGSWSAWRRAGEQDYVGHGDYDADDLLGLALNILGGQTIAPWEKSEEKDIEITDLAGEEEAAPARLDGEGERQRRVTPPMLLIPPPRRVATRRSASGLS